MLAIGRKFGLWSKLEAGLVLLGCLESLELKMLCIARNTHKPYASMTGPSVSGTKYYGMHVLVDANS